MKGDARERRDEREIERHAQRLASMKGDADERRDAHYQDHDRDRLRASMKGDPHKRRDQGLNVLAWPWGQGPR